MIHTFLLNGNNFAVDGNSGSVHILDGISYAVIDGKQYLPPFFDAIRLLGSRYEVQEIWEAYRELEYLKEKGILFSPDSTLQEAAGKRHMDKNLKALCLHVAHDCNLRCDYCFAGKGDYHTKREVMSPEVALQAVDFLVEHSGKKQNIEIDFFGGEPLINFETVKKVVYYGKKIENELDKHFCFTMTTNGMQTGI